MIGAAFEQVLAAAQAGDEGAFTALWRDGNPALLRYLAVHAPDQAEDVAAETWLHVVRGLADFTGDETSWRAWLFTLARRRAVDSARARDRARTVPWEDSDDVAVEAADPAVQLESRWDTQAALSAVAALPPLQAEVVMLRVVAGLGTEEVARLVGRSPGAVRVAAHRGLRRLGDGAHVKV